QPHAYQQLRLGRPRPDHGRLARGQGHRPVAARPCRQAQERPVANPVSAVVARRGDSAMKKAIPAIVLASALLLSGCSGFKSSAPPTALYTIHMAQAQPQAASRQKRIVSVAEPAVPPGFESDRIAVVFEQGRRMDYAAGAAWPAPLPKVLQ